MVLGRNQVLNVSILLLIALYIGFCGYLGDVANNDYWMVRAFDADESRVLEELISMFERRTFEPAYYLYGTLHEYIALISIYCLEVFRKPEIKDAVFILRFENAVAGGGIIWLVFLMAKEIGSFKAGIYSVAFLLLNSVFFAYGCNAKPELLQLLFITSALFFSIKGIDSNRWWFLAAGIMGGLAFITKFTGIFLFPMGVLATFLSIHKKESDPKGKLREIGIGTSMFFIGFMLAVAMFSPYMLRDFDVIIERLGVQTEINKRGFLFYDDGHWVQWFPIIFNASFLGYGLLLIYGSYTIDFIRGHLVSGLIRKDADKIFFLAVWVFFYGLYTIFGVVVRAERYILPVLPVLVLFAGIKVNEIVETKEFGMGKVIFLGAVLLFLVPNLLAVNSFVSLRLAREDSPRIVAGRWMLENIPLDARVSSNLYTYVPPVFTKHLHSKYLNINEVNKYQPDYIVSSREITQRFLDKSRSKKYTAGEEEYLLSYSLYSGLNEGSLPGYRLLKDFGETQIYMKSVR